MEIFGKIVAYDKLETDLTQYSARDYRNYELGRLLDLFSLSGMWGEMLCVTSGCSD